MGIGIDYNIVRQHKYKLVEDGRLYRNNYKFDIKTDSSEYILIETGNLKPYVFFNAKTDGDLEIQIYTDPQVTARGLEQYSGNFNLNYLYKVPITKWYVSPDIISVGNYLAHTFAFGGNNSFKHPTGTNASNILGLDVILAPYSMYLLKFINYAKRPMQVFFETEFIEELEE